MSDNIFVFYGEESFLVQQAVQELKKKIVTPGLETFGYVCLEGKKENFDELINNLQTLPVFSAQKLVHVKNPFFLLNANKNKETESGAAAEEENDGKTSALSLEAEELLINSISHLPEGIVVAFEVNGSIDQRRKIPLLLKKIAKMTEYKSFAFWEQDKLQRWLIGQFQEKGYTLSAPAAELLTEISGVSMLALRNELDKIITYVGDKKKIEVEDIKTIASQGELAGFDLQEALTNRDIKNCLIVLGRMLKEGEPLIVIIGMIAAHMRVLLQVKDLAGQVRDPFVIAEQLRKKPYYVKRLLTGLSKYSLEELKNFILELQQTDYKIKTGQMEPRLALEYALSTLIKN